MQIQNNTYLLLQQLQALMRGMLMFMS